MKVTKEQVKKDAVKQKEAKASANGETSLRSKKIRVKIVGIGGGGVSIINEMAAPLKLHLESSQYVLGGANFLALDTDARVFGKARKNIKVLQFGQNVLKGLGTGMNVEIAAKAAEEDKEKISKALKDQEIIIFVGCLGGGISSGAGPVITRIAQEHKAITIGVFTLPFGFEGEKKMLLAKKSAERLRENLSGIVVVPNEKIFQITDKKMPLKKSFSCLNQIFASWLNGILEIILKPSLINIDFADLKTILESKGSCLFLGQTVTHGANRAEESIKNIFHNQLFDGPPKTINRMLFNITGGRDLSIKEVEVVSSSISSLNPKAKIIFGITQDSKYAGKLKVSLLAITDKDKKVDTEKITEETKKIKPKNIKDNKKKHVRVIKNKSVIVKDKAEEPRETIRQSGLEVREAVEAEAAMEMNKENNWEIPAFLRKRM